MTYRATQLGSDVNLRPDQARATILMAVLATGGDVKAASDRLGLSERQLHRYVVRLQLQPQIAKIRERADRELKARRAVSG